MRMRCSFVDARCSRWNWHSVGSLKAFAASPNVRIAFFVDIFILIRRLSFRLLSRLFANWNRGMCFCLFRSRLPFIFRFNVVSDLSTPSSHTHTYAGTRRVTETVAIRKWNSITWKIGWLRLDWVLSYCLIWCLIRLVLTRERNETDEKRGKFEDHIKSIEKRLNSKRMLIKWAIFEMKSSKLTPNTTRMASGNWQWRDEIKKLVQSKCIWARKANGLNDQAKMNKKEKKNRKNCAIVESVLNKLLSCVISANVSKYLEKDFHLWCDQFSEAFTSRFFFADPRKKSK